MLPIKSLTTNVSFPAVNQYLCCTCTLTDAEFADVVHVSNHWILAQAVAHAPAPNFHVP